LTSIDDLIMEISDKNVDIEKFADESINDPEIRDYLIHLMLNNQKIMVYHHSFYIIAKASQKEPELFYQYWDDFIPLLTHPNSYHRVFALVLLANLTDVDKENKFSLVFDDYFSHINDEKFMTARKCIQNTAKILANREELTEDIINILLDVDKRCGFPEKRKALLKSDVIELFSEFYVQIDNKVGVNEFVKSELFSISPRTKKKAMEFVGKYNI